MKKFPRKKLRLGVNKWKIASFRLFCLQKMFLLLIGRKKLFALLHKEYIYIDIVLGYILSLRAFSSSLLGEKWFSPKEYSTGKRLTQSNRQRICTDCSDWTDCRLLQNMGQNRLHITLQPSSTRHPQVKRRIKDKFILE